MCIAGIKKNGKDGEPGSVGLCDQEAVTANNKFHMRKVDQLIKDNWWFIQREIATRPVVSQKCVDHIVDFLCVRCVPIHAQEEMKGSKVEICKHLSYCMNEDEEFLHSIMITNEIRLIIMIQKRSIG